MAEMEFTHDTFTMLLEDRKQLKSPVFRILHSLTMSLNSDTGTDNESNKKIRLLCLADGKYYVPAILHESLLVDIDSSSWQTIQLIDYYVQPVSVCKVLCILDCKIQTENEFDSALMHWSHNQWLLQPYPVSKDFHDDKILCPFCCMDVISLIQCLCSTCHETLGAQAASKLHLKNVCEILIKLKQLKWNLHPIVNYIYFPNWWSIKGAMKNISDIRTFVGIFRYLENNTNRSTEIQTQTDTSVIDDKVQPFVALQRRTQISDLHRDMLKTVLRMLFAAIVKCSQLELSDDLLLHTDCRSHTLVEQINRVYQISAELEEHLFCVSGNDFDEYRNLMLNEIAYNLIHWESGKIQFLQLKNAATQTEPELALPFVGEVGLLKTVLGELLQLSLADVTEQNLQLFLADNIYCWQKRKMKQQFHYLQCCHRWTQTMTGLAPGQKCGVGVSASPFFSWRSLHQENATVVWYFPLISRETQTVQDDIDLTSKISVKWTPKECEENNEETVIPVLVAFLNSWEAHMSALDFKSVSADVLSVANISLFLQLRTDYPFIMPGLCKSHKKKCVPGCPSCKLAMHLPEPWNDDVAFTIACLNAGHNFWSEAEKLSAKQICPATVKAVSDYQIMDDILSLMKKDRRHTIMCLLPQELVMAHVIRKFCYYHLWGAANDVKVMTCACSVSWDFVKSGFFYPKYDDTHLSMPYTHMGCVSLEALFYDGNSLARHVHRCMCCGKQEPNAKTYKVCQLCHKEKLFVKSFYCSMECMLKHWNIHKRLHDALNVSPISFLDLRKWDSRETMLY